MSDWNTSVIEEFRANKGMVGGVFAGAPLLLLATTGAKSGLERIVPLMYHDDGDVLHVFASKAGAHSHPDWYHNVRADPRVTVEVGTESFAARAVELSGAERHRVFEAHSSRFPQFADYQARTERLIPVFGLHPL